MTIPVELVVAICSGIGVVLSINAHLLLKVYGVVTDMSKDFAVSKAETGARIKSIEDAQKFREENNWRGHRPQPHPGA